MSEKPRTFKVFVKADMSNVIVGGFGRKQQPAPLFDKFVLVELTVAELRLKGVAFIQAAREALLRTLDEGEVYLINGNCEVNPDGTGLAKGRQQVGFSVNPDNIVLSDQWARS